MIPAMVEQRVAIKVVPMIAEGLSEPDAFIKAKVVVGIRVMEEVFITKKVHMALDAVSFLTFKF